MLQTNVCVYRIGWIPVETILKMGMRRFTYRIFHHGPWDPLDLRKRSLCVVAVLVCSVVMRKWRRHRPFFFNDFFCSPGVAKPCLARNIFRLTHKTHKALLIFKMSAQRRSFTKTNCDLRIILFRESNLYLLFRNPFTLRMCWRRVWCTKTEGGQTLQVLGGTCWELKRDKVSRAFLRILS